MQGKRGLFSVVVAILLLPTSALAATYVVDSEGGGDFTSIADAVWVATHGDTILVEPGVYLEHDIVVSDLISIIAPAGPDLTEVNGQNTGQIFDYVLSGGGELSGFTFINGRSSDGGGAVDVNIDGETLEIANCVFRYNVAVYQGGGLAVGTASKVYVSDCLFENNFAPEHSGAAVGIEGSVLEFDRCRFIENQCDVFSASVASHSSILNIRDCLFLGNVTGDVSGGVYMYWSSGLIEGNTFVGNTSPGRATVVVHESDGTTVRRNIFYQDTHGYGLQLLDCSGVHECNLYWGNADGPIDPPGLGPDEFVADPMFCNPAGDIYYIYDISPAAPEHSPCAELIGCYPVECYATGVLSTNWSEVKSLY